MNSNESMTPAEMRERVADENRNFAQDFPPVKKHTPIPATLAANPIAAHFDALAYLLSRKGQIVTITARRTMKTRKAVTSVCEKLSVFQAQVGVEYDNKKAVIAKRESGELPAENAGLPWGRWLNYPYIIEHNGKKYFRLYPVNSSFQRKVIYYVNGAESTEAIVRPLCLASEFDRDPVDVFTYPIDGILSVK